MGGITFLFLVDFRLTLRADEVRESLKIVVRMEISETITSTNKHEGLPVDCYSYSIEWQKR